MSDMNVPDVVLPAFDKEYDEGYEGVETEREANETYAEKFTEAQQESTEAQWVPELTLASRVLHGQSTAFPSSRINDAYLQLQRKRKADGSTPDRSTLASAYSPTGYSGFGSYPRGNHSGKHSSRPDDWYETGVRTATKLLTPKSKSMAGAYDKQIKAFAWMGASRGTPRTSSEYLKMLLSESDPLGYVVAVSDAGNRPREDAVVNSILLVIVAQVNTGTYRCFQIVQYDKHDIVVNQREHVRRGAIVYSSMTAPVPELPELTLKGGIPMLPPLRVTCQGNKSIPESSHLDASQVVVLHPEQISEVVGKIDGQYRTEFANLMTTDKERVETSALLKAMRRETLVQERVPEHSARLSSPVHPLTPSFTPAPEMSYSIAQDIHAANPLLESPTTYQERRDAEQHIERNRTKLHNLGEGNWMKSLQSFAKELPDDSKETPLRSVSRASPSSSRGAMDELCDMSALLDPDLYFDGLDNLESQTIQSCHIEEILPRPSGERPKLLIPFESYEKLERLNMETGKGSHARGYCSRLLSGVLSSVEMLKNESFLGDDINILIEAFDRPNVVRTVDLRTIDIQDLHISIKSELDLDITRTYPRSHLRHLVARVLSIFGVVADRDHHEFSRYIEEHLAAAACLLCSLLALAIVSFAGSHCSDFGRRIWQTSLEEVGFDGVPWLRQNTLYFRRRRLACLDAFIGGPAWVFGSTRPPDKALLSVKMEQFGLLWGPLYAVPSAKGFNELLAIHTDGGILFCTQESLAEARPSEDESLIHWISVAPMRKSRNKPGEVSERFTMPSRSQEQLPRHLTPFSSSSRMLIGQPTTSASSLATTTTRGQSSAGTQLTINLNETVGLNTYPHCNTHLETFGRENHSRIYPIGTRDADYVPDELQANFSGGQYINIGVQKVWKRRPMVTYKTRLLEFCAKPRVPANRILQILQLRIGLEVSACTTNARRTSLGDTIKLAYPNAADATLVEQACVDGDAGAFSTLLNELEATGVTQKDFVSFWPLGDALTEGYHLNSVPHAWLDLLKDTQANACFAVLSRECLNYRGKDDLSGKQILKLCSRGTDGSRSNPLLQTIINLDSQSIAQLPLAANARLRLHEGFLEIRNSYQTQLAVYERFSLKNKVEELAIVTRDGQKGRQHQELVMMQRASHSVVPVCIMDRQKK